MKRAFKMLDKNIMNPNFKKIIDLCFECTSYVSFTKDFGFIESDSSKIFDCELNKYLVKKIKTTHWYSHYMLDPNRPLEVSIYKANTEVKDIILNTFTDILLIGNKKPPVAEDICFFSNNKLLLGTLSHEGVCHIFPKDNQMLNTFFKFANWEEIEFQEKELIELNL